MAIYFKVKIYGKPKDRIYLLQNVWNKEGKLVGYTEDTVDHANYYEGNKAKGYKYMGTLHFNKNIFVNYDGEIVSKLIDTNKQPRDSRKPYLLDSKDKYERRFMEEMDNKFKESLIEKYKDKKMPKRIEDFINKS